MAAKAIISVTEGKRPKALFFEDVVDGDADPVPVAAVEETVPFKTRFVVREESFEEPCCRWKAVSKPVPVFPQYGV